jgi:ADP-ribosylglycohydrolase
MGVAFEYNTIVSDRGFRHRALGAVVGSAVGDALGAPFEFGPAGQYSARFPEPVIGGVGEMVGGGGLGWAPGEFTDDTQMAIVQAESILANGRVDGADLFDRFRAWAHDARDVGDQTRSVLSSGQAWNEAAPEHFRRNPGRGAGNGSLMRATPTAVRYAGGTAEATVAAALDTSIVTHGDPAAGWGTALHHLMIRAALHGDDPFAALADGLDRLPGDQQTRYRMMLGADWDPARSDLSNGAVWECLAQAVWAVRRSGSFADAVVTAIDLGDDTDTVAAVAGGLAGAIYGIQAIPSRWTTYLHGTVTTADGPRPYRSIDLQELTLRLLDIPASLEQPLVEPRGPVEIAPGLHAADLGAAGDVPRDWAVVSLCRVGDRFANHDVRRELYIVDDDADHNPGLAAVVDDAVATIDAFLAEGRQVVVHCHAGASRTGLVLRALMMRRHGWDEATATAHVAERWPYLALWNDSFTALLRNEA